MQIGRAPRQRTGVTPQLPDSFAWDKLASANGTHTLHAIGYDGAGNSGLSADVSVNVQNVGVDTIAPAA